MLFRNPLEPVIDIETWNMVQKRQKVRTRKLNVCEEEGLFSGKLFCADCKKPMARHYTGGNFSGFVCRTYKRQGRQFCRSHKIIKEELEDRVSLAVSKAVERQLTEKDRAELSALKYQDENPQEKQTQEALERRIDSLMRYKRGCFEKFLDGVITEEDFCVYQAEYKEQITALENQRALFCAQKEPEPDAQAEAWKLFDEIRGRNLSRELVNGLIEKIEVGTDGELTIYFWFREAVPKSPHPKMKRSMCGDGGIYSGERNRICESDE